MDSGVQLMFYGILTYGILIYYSKTPILEYHQIYSKIGVIYEAYKNFGPRQKIGFNIVTNQAKNLKSYLFAENALSKSVNGFLFQWNYVSWDK